MAHVDVVSRHAKLEQVSDNCLENIEFNNQPRLSQYLTVHQC